jgi:hypothetical protein
MKLYWLPAMQVMYKIVLVPYIKAGMHHCMALTMQDGLCTCIVYKARRGSKY